MGAGLNNGNGNGRRESAFRRRRPPMSEINVTPFVDVMLVLLIVFMVAAPLLTVGVPVDLPKTKAKALTEEQEPLTVTVQADGTIFLQETTIALNELTPKLIAIAQNGYEERIYVRGDQAVDYGSVMQVMGALNGAGFTRVALITESKTTADEPSTGETTREAPSEPSEN